LTVGEVICKRMRTWSRQNMVMEMSHLPMIVILLRCCCRHSSSFSKVDNSLRSPFRSFVVSSCVLLPWKSMMGVAPAVVTVSGRLLPSLGHEIDPPTRLSVRTGTMRDVQLLSTSQSTFHWRRTWNRSTDHCYSPMDSMKIC
jgi:hypothetical protein